MPTTLHGKKINFPGPVLEGFPLWSTINNDIIYFIISSDFLRLPGTYTGYTHATWLIAMNSPCALIDEFAHRRYFRGFGCVGQY